MYELCHGKHVRQYHEPMKQPKVGHYYRRHRARTDKWVKGRSRVIFRNALNLDITRMNNGFATLEEVATAVPSSLLPRLKRLQKT